MAYLRRASRTSAPMMRIRRVVVEEMEEEEVVEVVGNFHWSSEIPD